jgi:hypothetical protein
MAREDAERWAAEADWIAERLPFSDNYIGAIVTRGL